MRDLANLLIKETYKPRSILHSITTRDKDDIRESVQQAHRFILDEPMSELLASLATVPYEMAKGSEKQVEVLTSQRRSSRLPYPKMFVQFDGKAFRRGLQAIAGDKRDVWGQQLADPEEVIDPVGWLIEECRNEQDVLNPIIMLTEFFENEKEVITLPFSWLYATDELDLMSISAQPEMAGRKRMNLDVDTRAAQFAHGLTGHVDPSIGIVYTNLGGKAGIPPDQRVTVKEEGKGANWNTHMLVAEMGGVIRYAFAFLSTLNEVPVSYERARPTAHYIANGKRRAAVDVQHVRLVLPNRTINYRSFAKSIYHEIAKRKNHPVRGHWRLYCSTPSKSCNDGAQHQWGPTDATGHADCLRCDASRTWIKDHRRGDEALGRVDHTYSVGAR
jgi:hypothetical protein